MLSTNVIDKSSLNVSFFLKFTTLKLLVKLPILYLGLMSLVKITLLLYFKNSLNMILDHLTPTLAF